ncbi:MAG: DUF2399 domain-containing protein [Lachnospiraceae bacterium]|nr:DUF2399 domain-containing protein [Lachnospiraceae bacterium]
MNQLTALQRRILESILDQYENSKTYSGENKVDQTFKVRVSKVWPEYLDDFTDVLEIEEFERQVTALAEQGLITIRCNDRDEMVSFAAKADQMDDYYKLLNRQEKKILLDEEIRMYQEFSRDHTALGAFCRRQVELMSSGKRAQYQMDRARNYLALLQAIIHNQEELYERELSIQVLGDSKLFEQSYRKVVCKLLRNYGEYEDILQGEDEERYIERFILEQHHIYANPNYVYFKGSASIYLQNGEVMEIKDSLPIALSSAFLDQVISIHPISKRIITIENLTTFHRYQNADSFCIYLGGYHSFRKTQYLKKIDAADEKNWLHFGDIDPDGYMILRNLRRTTGLDFQAYCMDADTLMKYRNYTKKLETQDITKANTLLGEGFYPEIMNMMLEENMKLEQEIVVYR